MRIAIIRVRVDSIEPRRFVNDTLRMYKDQIISTKIPNQNPLYLSHIYRTTPIIGYININRDPFLQL